MLVLALALGAVVHRPAVGQSGPTSFTLVASASGVTTAVVAPNLSVVDTLVELGGSVAQAEVSSLGTSRAFAANPTPGELVLTGPGLLAGLSGLPVPNEQFPTTAQSSFPSQPEQTAGTPPLTLEARSEARRSDARAVTGQPDVTSTESRAVATVDDTGTSIAEASVVAGPIVAGPVVIGHVRAAARSVVRPDGSRGSETDFDVGAVVVDGQAARITPDGLELLGTEVPLAGADAPEELAEQGLQIRTLEGAEDPEAGTATSPSIEITIRQVLADGIPGVVPPGQEVIVRHVVGRAFAGASAVSLQTPVNRVPDLRSVPADVPTSRPGTGDVPAALPLDVPTAGSTSTPLSDTPEVALPDAGPRASTTGRAAPATSVRLVSSPVDSFLFYPVLVMAALVALASAQALRTGDRRRLWDEIDHDVTPREVPHA